MGALSNYVSLTISVNSVGVTRAGFGVALILSVNAAFAERVRTYSDLAAVAEDFSSTTSPEYLAAQALFAQNPAPSSVKIGRAVGQPTQRYQINISSVGVGYEYTVSVDGDGVTATDVSYTPAADLTVEAVTNGADSLTVTAHGMTTGDGPYRVSNSGGALPTGLSVDTDYWVISLTANTFSLATSKANALALTAVNLTSDGTGTQTLHRAQNDVICAQLVQGLNAVTGKNYTATQTTGAGETDYVVITGSAAGEWFSLEVSDVALMKIAQTHVEPATTLATDLTAINRENSSWYSLITLYNSNAYVLAAAAWVQSNKKLYLADVSDSESATLAMGGSDTLDDLKTLGYSRVAGLYHPSPAVMFSAALNGRCLPLDPGSETWALKTLSGVPAVDLTDTHRSNIVAKRGTSIESVAGLSITFGGFTADGNYIDVRRGLDWLEDDMTKSVFEALVGANKVSFTDFGIAVVEAEVRASLDRAERMTIITSGWSVVVPKAADISTADKAARVLNGIKFYAVLDGAIHSVNLVGSISV